jgi:hypothetical protein
MIAVLSAAALAAVHPTPDRSAAEAKAKVTVRVLSSVRLSDTAELEKMNARVRHIRVRTGDGRTEPVAVVEFE